MPHDGVCTLQIFNVFLVTTISGSLFDSIQDIIKNPTSIASFLATSLPKVSCVSVFPP